MIKYILLIFFYYYCPVTIFGKCGAPQKCPCPEILNAVDGRLSQIESTKYLSNRRTFSTDLTISDTCQVTVDISESQVDNFLLVFIRDPEQPLFFRRFFNSTDESAPVKLNDLKCVQDEDGKYNWNHDSVKIADSFEVTLMSDEECGCEDFTQSDASAKITKVEGSCNAFHFKCPDNTTVFIYDRVGQDFGYSPIVSPLNTDNGDIGYSTVSGATITFGGFLFRGAKMLFIGLSRPVQHNDPQDTHQAFRSFLMVGGGFILTMFSNPTLLAIEKASCRFYFIAVHFCYIAAMVQWLLEGWNVNQVLRTVHLNEWEVDWYGARTWGTRIVPRMVLSTVGVATFLLIVFQTGWNDLAADWTCVGVICQKTMSIWLPVFAAVFIIVLYAGSVFESSCLILSRRPLLAYKIDMRIQRQLSSREAERVQKCRDNHLMSLIGLCLLVIQWIAVIISSDYRDEPMRVSHCRIDLLGVLLIQESYTNPESRAKYIELFMRFLPTRFAPSYNPITLWSIDEVKEKYSVPKAEREAAYESFSCRNKILRIHHKWDLRLNHFLLKNPESEVNPALFEVFLEEMRHLKSHGGTKQDEEHIKTLFRGYMDTVPHKNPREGGRLAGRLELVTLAAEDKTGGVRLAKFFIVADFHTYTPEIPQRGDRRRRDYERRLEQDLQADIYEIVRAESREQTKFINSSILFWHYGNNVVR